MKIAMQEKLFLKTFLTNKLCQNIQVALKNLQNRNQKPKQWFTPVQADQI